MEGARESRAVAALAASIALPALESESAAQLAETEGLVTHLTSLVLIDEAGAVQDGIPATRKVALPTPRLNAMQSVASMHIMADMAHELQSKLPPSSRESVLPRSSLDPDLLPSPIHSELRLSSLGAKIDWDAAPLRRLQAGDLSALGRDVARAIQSASALPEVVVLAKRLALHPVALVIGLIARAESSRSRSATRLAKAILCDITHEGLDPIAQMLGLRG